MSRPLRKGAARRWASMAVVTYRPAAHGRPEAVSPGPTWAISASDGTRSPERSPRQVRAASFAGRRAPAPAHRHGVLQRRAARPRRRPRLRRVRAAPHDQAAIRALARRSNVGELRDRACWRRSWPASRRVGHAPASTGHAPSPVDQAPGGRRSRGARRPRARRGGRGRSSGRAPPRCPRRPPRRR